MYTYIATLPSPPLPFLMRKRTRRRHSRRPTRLIRLATDPAMPHRRLHAVDADIDGWDLLVGIDSDAGGVEPFGAGFTMARQKRVSRVRGSVKRGEGREGK